MKSTTLLGAAALGGPIASASTACCTMLSQALGSRVSYPGDSKYNGTEASYWSLQESDLRPGCIVQPSTADDVSRAVSLIGSTSDCRFAIKGQGHSPAAGFANVDGGVTIDMTTLASVETNGDDSVAMVGAGASWLDVYRHLDPLAVSVAGGRNGNVGVGGLLLGGGISHFTTRVGWACDSVVNYQLVLANGSLVNANRTSRPDLFRALKGGANNFGVVTRFDVATFQQGNVSSTKLVNDISHLAAVFDAFTDLAGSQNYDVYASLVTGLLFNATSKQWAISNSAVYTKPDPKPAVFAKLSAIPSISNSTSVTSLSALADERATPPLNWLFATATFKPNSQLMMELFDILNTTLYSFNPTGGVVWSIAFEPLAGKMLPPHHNTDADVLGIGPDDKGFIFLISALWPDSTSRQAVEDVARRALSRIETHARSKRLLQRFQYLNYAAPYQTPLQSYGKGNLAFLREVSARYDSQGVFQRRVKGGFKL